MTFNYISPDNEDPDVTDRIVNVISKLNKLKLDEESRVILETYVSDNWEFLSLNIEPPIFILVESLCKQELKNYSKKVIRKRIAKDSPIEFQVIDKFEEDKIYIDKENNPYTLHEYIITMRNINNESKTCNFYINPSMWKCVNIGDIQSVSSLKIGCDLIYISF